MAANHDPGCACPICETEMRDVAEKQGLAVRHKLPVITTAQELFDRFGRDDPRPPSEQ